jgi:hypothetical protein
LETGFSKNKKVEHESVEHLKAAVPASGGGSAALPGLFWTAGSQVHFLTSFSC